MYELCCGYLITVVLLYSSILFSGIAGRLATNKLLLMIANYICLVYGPCEDTEPGPFQSLLNFIKLWLHKHICNTLNFVEVVVQQTTVYRQGEVDFNNM